MHYLFFSRYEYAGSRVETQGKLSPRILRLMVSIPQDQANGLIRAFFVLHNAMNYNDKSGASYPQRTLLVVRPMDGDLWIVTLSAA
ncbi:MAG: hypothetical protein JJU24_09190 [Natronohydrobacter sp.]|nr:hypothetical protein [Natronohydrobacter sp.]